MPKHTSTRRSVATLPKSPRDLTIQHLTRRDLAAAAAETLFLKAELALLLGDLGGFESCLSKLAGPDPTCLVDPVVSVRLWAQLGRTQRRGWSAERTENAARRSWPDEPDRVDLLLDALDRHDASPTKPIQLDQWAQCHQTTRLDTLITAAFVDLWLTALSTYDPSDIADTEAVRDAHAR